MERARRLTWSEVFSSPWILAVILGLAVLFYAPSLDQWFFGDDFHFLRRSQTIGWGPWFTQAWDFRDPRPVPEFPPYRPLYLLTFRAEYTLFGLHSVGYHAVNLAAHLVAVVILWLIVMRLTQRRLAAHLAALVFALHPAYTISVAWISNGNTVIATDWYLLAFLLFMKHAEGDVRHVAWYAAFLLALATAFLYHPVTTPIVVALAGWWFLVHHTPGKALQWRTWVPFVPVAMILLPFAAIERWVRAQNPNEVIAFSVSWHMFHVYLDYLALALYPSLHAGPAPLASGAMLIITAVLLTRWRRPAVPVFAVLWFYSSLAPDSTFVFGAQPRVFYLPGASLAVLLAVAAVVALDAAVLWAARLKPISAPHVAYGIGALVVVVVAASLMRAVDPARLPNAGTILGEAAANKQLLGQLRHEELRLPPGGTLYVVNPPRYLVAVGTDYNLESLVQLYYGDVRVLVVPLTQPPFWNEQQVRAAMRSSDRIIVFQSGASP